MFHKILIANRGEIADIISAFGSVHPRLTNQTTGGYATFGTFRSVAVYSKEDKNSLHVQLADQRVCIGEGPARNNYLNMERASSQLPAMSALMPFIRA